MKAKTHLSQNKSRGGFTLVEMLVVIGMIATLAGISFPVYKSIQKKVEKQELTMEMQSLKSAWDNFETEYNYLPYIGATYPGGDQNLNSGDISLLLGVLVGAGNTVNFKQIKFFEPREAQGSAGNYNSGLLTNADGSVVYYTPWGTEIVQMRVDYNLDGIINFAYGLGDQETSRRYIYFEPGPDAKYDHVAPIRVLNDLENHRTPNYP